MGNRKAFLAWWLIAVYIIIMLGVSFELGILNDIWEKDFTKLSFLNIGILISATIWCGFKSWKLTTLSAYKVAPQNALKKLENTMEAGWFVSDITLTIGMVGTVTGFIAMLSGFADLNVEDIATVQGLITELGFGMSTALYTTLTGLVSSVLLKIQCFNISNNINKLLK